MYHDAAVTLLEPVYDRPPEGLARGHWGAPPWAVATIAAVVLAAAIAYLVVRAVRARRALRSSLGRGARR